MTEKKQNLSDVPIIKLQHVKELTIAIVRSKWNEKVTKALQDGAVEYLCSCGFSSDHILIREVPGSFELPLAAQMILEDNMASGVICLGCIIQGETRHFEFIAQAVAKGVMDVSLTYNAPVIFGILTTDTQEQAVARAGGDHGNKGTEAAATLLSMLQLRSTLQPEV